MNVSDLKLDPYSLRFSQGGKPRQHSGDERSPPRGLHVKAKERRFITGISLAYDFQCHVSRGSADQRRPLL
jgi:hypothetical protein